MTLPPLRLILLAPLLPLALIVMLASSLLVGLAQIVFDFDLTYEENVPASVNQPLPHRESTSLAEENELERANRTVVTA